MIEKIGDMKLDELFASVKNDVHTRVVTITSATALKRGQLIGSDGSVNAAFVEGNTPVGILCADLADASAGVKAEVYVSGHFNGNQVTGYSVDVDEELRDMGIFVDKAFAY